MQRQLFDDSTLRSVAVVRALAGLGDLLCAVPALRALRAALPGARMTLIGLPGTEWFPRRFPAYVDEFLEFPGFPGIVERTGDPRALPEFFAAAHRRHFDLAMQMHGSGAVSNMFVAMLGAQRSAGFYLPGLYCPDERTFLPYPESEPEVRRLVRLVEHLGMPVAGEHLEWPVRDDDRRSLAEVPGAGALAPGAYVVVHPGARAMTRRWPVEHFAAVADALAARGLDVVVTGSPDEVELAERLAGLTARRPLVLAGRTDLGALGALLAGARLLVSNDTGVSHLAAALRVPSVVVFMSSDPTRWAPADRARHRVVGGFRLEHPRAELPLARLCLRDGCLLRHELPILPVTPDDVLAQARALLGGEVPLAS